MCPAPKACPVEQEEKVLAAAAACINESSLMDFTMSAIAKKAGMSMGSIYKYIHSKEDVLVALAVHVQQRLKACFTHVYQSSLSLPEQIIALSLLDFNKVDPYPFARHLEMLCSNQVLLERASPMWRERLLESGTELTQVCESNCRKAIDENLLLEEGNSKDNGEDIVQQMTLAMWSLNVGTIQVLLHTAEMGDQAQEKLPFPRELDDPHILNMKRLINSFHWKQPLTNDGVKRAADILIDLGYR